MEEDSKAVLEDTTDANHDGEHHVVTLIHHHCVTLFMKVFRVLAFPDMYLACSRTLH